MFIQSPWSQLCDFCSQQEHFLESFLCKLDPVTNEVFLLIALLCVLEEEKEDKNNRFYDTLSCKWVIDKMILSGDTRDQKFKDIQQLFISVISLKCYNNLDHYSNFKYNVL